MEVTFLGSKRLVLQCAVSNTAELGRAFQEKAAITADFHLTLLHLGKSIALFHEVEQKTSVPLPVYEERMVHFLSSCVRSSHQMYLGTIESSELLRDKHSWHSILRVVPEPALFEVREKCRLDFLLFLRKNGVRNPEEFMRDSQAIQQYSPQWLPHITIATERDRTREGNALVGQRVIFGPVHVRRS